MSAPAPTAIGWTRRRWIWIMAGGLFVHVALVVWFGERVKPVGVVAAPDPLLTLAPDPELVHSPRLSDPTLFALPSAEGFSGGAWLRWMPAESVGVEWTEPPRWLPLETNELGGVFLRFVATNKPVGSVIEDLLEPRVSTADIFVLNDPLMTQSVVTVEGPLSGRPLLRGIRPFSPVHPDVLPDTTIQLRVNRAGSAESVFLLEGCGVRSVDEQALAAARTAQFQPAGSGEVAQPAVEPGSWGKLVFHWLTVPRAN
jgi:TonB family protein